MLFEGQAVTVSSLNDGLVELKFDLQGESVNKFNTFTLSELAQAIAVIEGDTAIKGVLVTSGKPVFVVGADVTEFGDMFKGGEVNIRRLLSGANATFNKLEDLEVPTVVAINGYALGGGFEVCLACDYRVMARSAKVGLPETQLGIMPGWGGTVRLPRLAGVDVAVEWIAGGKEYKADVALKSNVIDGVVDDDKVRDAALNVLSQLVAGKLDYTQRKERKKSPLSMNDMESLLAFESSKAFIKAQAGRNYPAPVEAVKAIQAAAKFGREDALNFESAGFVKMALTPVAESLVGLFLNDQMLAKKAKAWEKQADKKITKAAVLGAGIMGGGIAYQSAYKGTPVIMKDIAQAGIDLGLGEAAKLLTKQVERGRITTQKMAETLNSIDPTLSYDEFKNVDIVVEAVVENPKVKHAVLTEVESKVSADTIIASNTSTISITHLAQPLKRPENFCGMHFFNPVHRMPLVEVIRAQNTSDKAIASTVAYANALGKKAIVVNDCPGFLVNRVLFPYFAGFSMLLRDGADFQQIDKVMEKWGWPMGPAYLMDVVGIDTGVHAQKVMAEGFPERMGKTFKAASDILFEAKRYGQKNNVGFYAYTTDKKGKPKKEFDPVTLDLLKPHVAEPKTFSDDEIIARMMIPMATEIARCVEEGIVGSVEEADLALIYGLGFPPFRGGVFRWIDSMGIAAFTAMARPYESLGPLYQMTQGMNALSKTGEKYYRSNERQKEQKNDHSSQSEKGA